MSTAGLGAPAVAPSHAGDPAPRSFTLEDRVAAAWLCALPCMALVVAVGLVLGPPLGRLLAGDASAYAFFPEFAKVVRPESTEHARYLIALSLPLLMSLAVLVAPRWLPRVPHLRSARAVTAAQALLAGLVAACYVAQVQLTYGSVYMVVPEDPPFHMRYFTLRTLLVAALLAGSALLVLYDARLRGAAARLLRDSRVRRAAAATVALAATAVWMLHAVQSDASAVSAAPGVAFHLSFTIDETFAVINGLTPLVDFSAQYGSLWPYVSALSLLAFGKTALVFTLTMCTLTGLALLSVYGILRRVARSPLGALLLYLPFLATSLFLIEGTLANRSTVGTYYGTFPLRYAIPYFLAFLTARHIDRRGGPAGVALLFLVGGLAILNNGDFGFAALGATAAALIWSATDRPRPPLRRLAAAAGAGLLAAFALVSLLTLVRAGQLPHLSRLVDYARLFATAGFGMMPIPGLFGLHLAIYLTYVAAIVVATVRALRGASERLLTGMLAWSGVFGLGSAVYYVGRSHPNTLRSLFSAWALALALLTVVAVRSLAAHPRRRPTIAAVAVLLGFGVAACSLAQTPMPWSQLARLEGPFIPYQPGVDELPLVPSTDPATRAFVSALADGPNRWVVRRGAPVAIMLRTGHRVADAYGLRDVSAYTGVDSTPTAQRMEEVIDALQRAGGNTVILPNPVDAGIFRVLERRGFRLLTYTGLRRYDPSIPHSNAIQLKWPYDYILKWVDVRHLHPRFLHEPAHG